VALRRACPRPEIVQVVTDTRSSRRNQAAGDELRVPMVLTCGSQCTLRLWRLGNPQVRREAICGRESSGVSGKVAGGPLGGVIRSLLEVVTCLFAAYGFVALVAGR